MERHQSAVGSRQSAVGSRQSQNKATMARVKETSEDHKDERGLPLPDTVATASHTKWRQQVASSHQRERGALGRLNPG